MSCSCTRRSVPLFTKRTFTFSGLQTGTSLELVMAKQLDVGEYGDATLLVRVHSATVSSGSSIEASAYTIALCSQEPETDFVSSQALATATVSSSTADGALLVDAVSPNFGGSLQIRVKGTRSSGTVTAVLSAELVLRPGAATKPKVAGDFRLDSADPVLGVGNGRGSPRAELDKEEAGTAGLFFQNVSVDRWSLKEDASEWLVFERYDSSGVKQDEPLQIRESDGGVRGKLLHQTHHNYSQASYGYCIVPWNTTAEAYSTSNPSSFVGGYYSWTVAPFDGRLLKVYVRSSNAWSGSNSSAVRLYAIAEGATTKTARGSWVYESSVSADYTREYDMGSSATLSKGEKIGILVWTNSSNTHGDIQVTAIWELDQTESHGGVF